MREARKRGRDLLATRRAATLWSSSWWLLCGHPPSILGMALRPVGKGLAGIPTLAAGWDRRSGSSTALRRDDTTTTHGATTAWETGTVASWANGSTPACGARICNSFRPLEASPTGGDLRPARRCGIGKAIPARRSSSKVGKVLLIRQEARDRAPVFFKRCRVESSTEANAHRRFAEHKSSER